MKQQKLIDKLKFSIFFDQIEDKATFLLGGFDESNYKQGEIVQWINMNFLPPLWLAMSSGFMIGEESEGYEFFYS
jgi:hypothetical protein